MESFKTIKRRLFVGVYVLIGFISIHAKAQRQQDSIRTIFSVGMGYTGSDYGADAIGTYDRGIGGKLIYVPPSNSGGVGSPLNTFHSASFMFSIQHTSKKYGFVYIIPYVGDLIGNRMLYGFKFGKTKERFEANSLATTYGEFNIFRRIPVANWMLMPGIMLSSVTVLESCFQCYNAYFSERIWLGPYFQARYRHNATWQHSFIVSYMPVSTNYPQLSWSIQQIWKFNDVATGYYAYRIDHHRWFASLEWRKLYHFKPFEYEDPYNYGQYLKQTYWLNPNKWSLHIGYAIRLSKKR